MQDSPIQIGSISLQDFEIPSSVRFGGRHRLAVHILSSGKRVVERLGPEDGEIVFQGTFSGPDAETRVNLFDNLRLSGEIVWLTWKSFRRRVIVKSFVAEYRSPWWIPYHVSCAVIHQAGVTAGPIAAVAALISADLTSAVTGSAMPFTSLRLSLSAPNVLTGGTSDHAEAVAAVGLTLNALDSEIAERSNRLIIPTEPGRHAEANARVIATTVIDAGSLATAVNTRSYIGRIRTNLIGGGN